MDWASLLYLGVTFALFAVMAVIVYRTYRRDRRQKLEDPKYRMLDDDD